MNALKIGGLCFGYGGLDLAVQSVIPNAELAWYAEFDKGASKIGTHRFPGVPNHGDMTQIDWAAVEPVDIITGGTPCQDLSHAGKRKGMTEGTRSNLWVAMREAIATIRPGVVVWENVRGAYSAAADSEVEPCPGCMGDPRDRGPALRALGRVLGDLSDLGYDCRWHGLRAADVGAPHGRFRVFVVAADAQRGGQHGWTPDAIRGPLARTAAAGRGEGALLPTPRAGDGIKGGPNQRGSSGDLMLPSAVTLLPTPTSRMKAAHGNGNGHGPSLNVEAQRLVRPVRTVIETEAASDLCCGAYTQSWVTAEGVDYGPAIRRWHDLTRCAPPPTEVGGKGGRRLSPRFSEFMMGLPAGWVTDVPGITRNEALKALGNGVVPQQAAAALRLMLGTQAVAA